MLFCAVDHSGIKPFYYYQSDRVFVFASEIKALLCLPEVPRRLNEVRVADYLIPMLEDKTITFYQDIFRLPPGHSLMINREGSRLRAYWSLDPTRELRLDSDEAYAEAFRELFTEAVRCRLRSAYPVGSMLSGGLDSSSIVCTARNLLKEAENRPLHTFSAIFPSLTEEELLKIDERRYINAVLAMGDLEPHYVRVDQLSPLADLEGTFECQDEAMIAPQLFMAQGLYRAAHQEKIRVVLDGFGGDSTVSHGTVYLTELVHTGQWATFAAEITARSQHFPVSPWAYLRDYGLTYLTELARRGRWVTFAREAHQVSKHFDISRSNLFLNYGLKRLVPEPIRQFVKRGRAGNSFADKSSPIINRDFARRIALAERQALQNKESTSAKNAREDHYLELTSGVVPLSLAEANKVAAAHSVEVRFPFFDKRLLEFCLSLPPDQKFQQGWSRMILRRAMANILPPEVQWRNNKANLRPNFTRGLLNFDRKILDQVILSDPVGVEPYVNVHTLRETYQYYIATKTGAAELTVWRMALLSLWLRYTGLTP